MLKLLNFSCSRCSFPSDHSDHFLVNINTPLLLACPAGGGFGLMLWRTAFRGFPWRVMFVRMGKGRVELTIPCRKGLAPCAR